VSRQRKKEEVVPRQGVTTEKERNLCAAAELGFEGVASILRIDDELTGSDMGL
jgi:hypothetical protein